MVDSERERMAGGKMILKGGSEEEGNSFSVS